MKDSENTDENKFSEEESEEEESEEEESEEEESEEEESEEEEIDGIELIHGKGKVEKVEEEVNRSLSIRELKDICQKMDLSTSGNKETLVKRINSKK